MESWKKIDNYDNYMISNLGNIKNIKRNKLLSPSKNTWGYLGVLLHKNGDKKRYQMHRLVANAFIPNLENKKEVNHKDGNKLNNHVDNLEWVTRSENMIHAYQMGLEKSPSTGKCGKLNKRSKEILQFTKDGKFIQEYESANLASIELSKTLNKNSETIAKSISKCCLGNRVSAYGYKWQFKNEKALFEVIINEK